MISTTKNRKTSPIVGALSGLCLLVFSANAHAVVDIGVTAKFGTTGIGADVTVPIVSNWINLRAGYNWFEFRPSIDEAGIDYQADVDFETVPLLVDLHPFHGNFRVTAGVYYNNNQLSLTATPTGSFNIGTLTIRAGSGISLRSTVDWQDKFAPYFGIGWGNAVDDNFLDLPIAIGFSADVGAFYQGNARVNLIQVGGIIRVPQAQLDAEAAELADSISDTKFFPVVTVGIHIRF